MSEISSSCNIYWLFPVAFELLPRQVLETILMGRTPQKQQVRWIRIRHYTFHSSLVWHAFLRIPITPTAVRACRNAIEFNSIPSINRLVPNGYDGLKLDVTLAIPPKYRDSVDLDKVQAVFPYGSIRFQIQDGGMIAPSGIAIERLGDKNEDMVVVCAAVTVGH
jgi:uncharacterized protein (TIGR02058 family)